MAGFPEKFRKTRSFPPAAKIFLFDCDNWAYNPADLARLGEAAVRLTTTVVCIFLSFGPLTFGQSSRPVPAGMREAQKWEAQNEKDFPPPKSSRATVKPEMLQDEAKQLADLAASIPSGVESANKGLLDKELLKTLKEIEKLSKRLHDELKH